MIRLAPTPVLETARLTLRAPVAADLRVDLICDLFGDFCGNLGGERQQARGDLADDVLCLAPRWLEAVGALDRETQHPRVRGVGEVPAVGIVVAGPGGGVEPPEGRHHRVLVAAHLQWHMERNLRALPLVDRRESP